MREDFGEFSNALERRFVALFALTRGRMALRKMAAEQVISKEVLLRVEQQIDRAWQRAIKRPQLRVQQLDASRSGRLLQASQEPAISPPPLDEQ